jgi:cation-transporting ATPase 13A3/4/5
LEIQEMQRDIFEQDLDFLGFVVMENKIKEATNPTIKKLNECNIRTIMATGDSILTAIAVAKDCNILSKGFETIYYGDIEMKKEQPELIWKNSESLVTGKINS